MSARIHINFEIDSFSHLLTFSQVIDARASNHCKKIKICTKIIIISKVVCFHADIN